MYAERRQADMPQGCLYVTAGDYMTANLMQDVKFYNFNIFNCHSLARAQTAHTERVAHMAWPSLLANTLAVN